MTGSRGAAEGGTAPAAGGLLSEERYGAYLTALLAGDVAACRRTVDDLRAGGATVPMVYEGLFRRSLYDVGERWARREASVADEHLATAVTQSLVHSAFPDVFSAERVGRRAVVSCLANERHELGGRMVADVLELAGWDTVFLGADTPLDALVGLVRTKAPDLLLLSLTIPDRLPLFVEALAVLRGEFPDLPVFAGGQAFVRAAPPVLASRTGVTFVPSLESLLAELARVPRRPSRASEVA